MAIVSKTVPNAGTDGGFDSARGRNMGNLRGIFAVLAVLCLVAPGCDRGNALGRVHGRVTYQRQPVSAGILVFSNHRDGVHITAELNSDGTYELQTAGGFGLPLGTYQVAINPPIAEPPVLGAPKVATPVPPSVKIPAKYRDFETSGLSINVREGDNPFDVDMMPERAP